MPDGFVGVTVFFTLSGYLITNLLIAEFDVHGRIDAVAFYLRRAARLLPGLVVVILATVVLLWIHRPDATARQILGPAGAALTYLTNIVVLTGHRPALENYFGYTWTLSIEEQFYLLWPALLVFGYRRSPVALSWALGALVGFLAVYDSYLGLSRSILFDPHQYFGSDVNALPILAGALLAIVLRRSVGRRLSSHLATIGLVALVALPVLARRNDSYHVAAVTAAASGLSVLVLLGALARPGAASARVLSLRVLTWLGRRSYSLYLWNIVVRIAVIGTLGSGYLDDVIWLAVVLVLGELSYRLIERPARRRLFARRIGAAHSAVPA